MEVLPKSPISFNFEITSEKLREHFGKTSKQVLTCNENSNRTIAIQLDFFSENLKKSPAPLKLSECCYVGMVLRRNCDHGRSVGMVIRRNDATSEWCYVGMVLRRNGHRVRSVGIVLRRNGDHGRSVGMGTMVGLVIYPIKY